MKSCRKTYPDYYIRVAAFDSTHGTESVVMSFTEAVDRRHVLVRLLRRLPAVQREVLVFRYMLDASVADTAAALDIAEGTVKSAASRGLDQLRMLMSAEYEDKKVRRVHPR